jgi:hypothetical protein
MSCGDLSSAPTVTKIADDAYVGTSGINWGPLRSASLASIDLGGTRYRALAYIDQNYYVSIWTKAGAAAWTQYTLDGTGVKPLVQLTSGHAADGHYAVSIEFSPDGRLHIAYDMWDDDLNLRSSTNTIQTFNGAFGSERTISGVSSVTYVMLYRDRGDHALYMLWRKGSSNDGDAHLHKYNHGTDAWAAAPGTSTDGLVLEGAGDSWYTRRPVCSSDWDGAGNGWMMFAGAWRVDGSVSGQGYRNVSAFFYDGTTFYDTDASTTATIPILQGNDDEIETVASELGVGSPGLAADDDGNFSLAYRYNGSTWHAFWDSSTQTWTKNDIAAHGIAQPAIVHRADGTAVAYGRHDVTQQLMKWVSNGTDYSTWTPTVIGDGPYPGCPISDQYAWETDKNLEFLAPYHAWEESRVRLDGMAAYWELNEASGTRYDSFGLNHLTDTNTVGTSATAISVASADLENSTHEQLECEHNANVSPSGAFTFGAWVRAESLGATAGIGGKNVPGGDLRSWNLTAVSGVPRFSVAQSGTSSPSAFVDSSITMSTATWYFVAGVFDPDNNLLTVYVNGTVNTAAVAFDSVFNNTTVIFTLGRGSSTTNGTRWDGLMDEAFLYSRALTTAELDWYFNSGTGRSFTEVSAISGTLKIPAGMSGGFDRYMNGGFNV